MRYPLIDIPGNNGNISGDPQASSRYTECRLMSITEDGMLSNLKKKNVEFQPNYTDEEEEPCSLPAIMPNLLVNPNMGIGVALACNWACHNLYEVGQLIINYMKTNELNFDDFAPDFPTGCEIINKNELKTIYTEGKGRVVLRARYKTESRKGQDLLVFYEVPYGVKLEDLITDIKTAIINGSIQGVDDVRDETTNKDGVRIVFDLMPGVDASIIANTIYASCDLQKTFSVNQVALDLDGTPKQLNWQQCIDIYITHNINCIKKEVDFDLQKINDRLEVVNGLLKALEDIDNIIALIKASESSTKAKEQLIAKYNFTEKQAQAIIDMKLGKLAGLDRIEIQQEQQELTKEQDRLNTLISNDNNIKEEISKRLSELINKYKDDRRTVINEEIVVDKVKDAAAQVLP